MKSLLRKTAILAALTLLPLAGTVSTAGAAVLACGATVTVNTVLENNVGPCEGGGIVIGANNVTLDLNGHQVFGRPGPEDGIGILVLGRTGVTVQNGTVHNFDGGVVIEGGSGNRVQYVTARDNIGRAGVTRVGDGIAVLSSRDNTIFGNNAANNGPFAGIGVYSEVDADHPRATSGVSSGNLIDSNTAVNNRISRTGIVTNTDNDGIRIEPGSVANTIVNNRATGNGLDGIAIFARSTDNVIRRNNSSANGFRTSARRGDGIRVFATANRTVIEANLTVRNGDHGIIVGSLNNRIAGNTAMYNRAFPPLNVNNPPFDLRDQNATCDNNLWLDNRYITVNPPCAGDMP